MSTRSKNAGLDNARRERGTLIASGFIAGGALMGVVSAFLRFGGINYQNAEWFESNNAAILGGMMFLVLCGYFIWDALRGKEEVE